MINKLKTTPHKLICFQPFRDGQGSKENSSDLVFRPSSVGLLPGVVLEDVPAIEGVYGHIVFHSHVSEDGLPAVKQHLVLRPQGEQRWFRLKPTIYCMYAYTLYTVNNKTPIKSNCNKRRQFVKMDYRYFSLDPCTLRFTMGMRSRSDTRTMLCRSCNLDDRKARNVPFMPIARAWLKHRKSAPRMPLMVPVWGAFMAIR